MSKKNTFHCKDCHCFFKNKQNYEYHLASNKHNLRISKDKIKLHSCSICQQTFTYSSGLSRHRIKCKEKEVIEIPKIDILEKEVKELHQQNLKLSKEVEDLKKNNKEINIQTQNNIENQNIKNQYNNIIINCFGSENLDYITDKVILHCMEKIYGSLPLLIEKIHFDPNHPENHNIQIPNKKLPHAKIINHKREWQIVQKKDVIEDMIDMGYSMLDEKFQEKGHELPENKQKHFRNFQEKYEDGNKKTQKDIRNRVENVIIDRNRS
jgi:hypothetical protein